MAHRPSPASRQGCFDRYHHGLPISPRIISDTELRVSEMSGGFGRLGPSPASTERIADLPPHSVQYGYSRPVKAYFEPGQQLSVQALTSSPVGSMPEGTPEN